MAFLVLFIEYIFPFLKGKPLNKGNNEKRSASLYIKIIKLAAMFVFFGGSFRCVKSALVFVAIRIIPYENCRKT